MKIISREDLSRNIEGKEQLRSISIDYYILSLSHPHHHLLLGY